ncbi:MAG: DNA repair protein RecO [Candidatus Omnitrophota bacterium]
MQRIKKTKGVVIKKRDFRDTSILVTFFTYDYGKIRVLAKGIKKDYRKFASHLNQFSLNDIVFYERYPREYGILSQADLSCANSQIFQSVKRIAVAAYLAELVDKTMPVFSKNSAVFKLLLEVYANLGAGLEEDKLLRIFEIKFLELSGFKPRLDTCVSCQVEIKKACRFSMSSGGLLCRGCFNKDPRAKKVSLGTIATMVHIEQNDWQKLLRLNLTANTALELKHILRDFLDFHMEKRLQSLRFLNQIN